MANDSSGKKCTFMIIGITVIIGGFFGGFMQFFWMEDLDIGMILFYVLVIPAISFLVGAGIILYGMKDSMQTSRLGIFGSISSRGDESKERTYIHEPPSVCKSCGASLSTESIEWVGPLSVKCSYCGATHATEKREV